MKKILDLAFKLGYTIDTKADKYLVLCQIQIWLISKGVILTFPPAVTSEGVKWAFKMVDGRSGFYNVKAETKYDFKDYKQALEAGIQSGLTYIQSW